MISYAASVGAQPDTSNDTTSFSPEMQTDLNAFISLDDAFATAYRVAKEQQSFGGKLTQIDPIQDFMHELVLAADYIQRYY